MAPFRLGQDDPAGACRHHRVEILARPVPVQRIDSHPQARAVLFVRAEKFGDHAPRFGLVGGGHRILEIEDDDICRATCGLFHLAGAVARRE